MNGPTMREVLLHGGADEAFDRSVVFARQLAESFGARLHIIYTVEDPLAAGWTAEMSRRAPAGSAPGDRERSARTAGAHRFRSKTRSGSASSSSSGPGRQPQEVVMYTSEHPIDLAIVQVPVGDGRPCRTLAHALIERGRCAVLVLR